MEKKEGQTSRGTIPLNAFAIYSFTWKIIPLIKKGLYLIEWCNKPFNLLAKLSLKNGMYFSRR
jgi:hypothetical protein